MNTFTIQVEFEVQGWSAASAANQLDARLGHLIGEVGPDTAIQGHRVLTELEDEVNAKIDATVAALKDMKTLTGEEDYADALSILADRWVAANGGAEEPFTYNRQAWLYVFNPHRGRHGYLNLSTDIVQDGSPMLLSGD